MSQLAAGINEIGMPDPSQLDGLGKAVQSYNQQIIKLQTTQAAAQASFWGIQKATEAASKTFASSVPTIKTSAEVFEKLQISTGNLGKVLQKGFEVGQILKVFNILQEGAIKMIAQFDRIPQALSLMNASGVSTGVIDEFSQITEALKLNGAAIDQFSLNAVARFNEFNAGLTRVQTLFTKESGFNVEKYGEDLQKLVDGPLKNSITSIEALDGAYNAISAGFTKAADSQAVMTAGLKLAKAGGADSADVMRLLGATLNAYGKSASEAGKVGAQLNLIVQKGITTIPELAGGFAETATTAKSAGVSLEDLSAAVAVLTTKGNSTPSALTGIESISRNIIAKTPEATKALEGLVDAAGKPVKFDITEIKADGLAKSLQRLNQAVGGNVVKLKEIIPESRAYSTALALMQNNSKDLADISLQMGQTTAKALDEVFGQQIAQKSEKFVQIVNRFGEVMIKLGKSLTPAFESGLKVLDTVSETIAKIPDGVKENIAQFLLAGLAFKQTTGAVGVFTATLVKAFLAYQGFRLSTMAFNGELFKQIDIIGKLYKANAGLLPVALQLFGVDQQRILAEKDLLVGGEKNVVVTKTRVQAAKELATEKKDLVGALKTLIGLDREALIVSSSVAKSYDEQVAAIQPLVDLNKRVKKSREEATKANSDFVKAEETLNSKREKFSQLEEELLKKKEAQKQLQEEASKLLQSKDTTPEVRKQVVEKVETIKSDVGKSETERLIRLKEIQRQEELVGKAKNKVAETTKKEADTVAQVTKDQLELVSARRNAAALAQKAKEAETLAEIANTEAKTANALASKSGFKDVALNTAAEEANTIAKTQNAIASKSRVAATEADIAVRKINTGLLQSEAIAENKLIETKLLGLKTTVGNNAITKLFTTNISDLLSDLSKTVSTTLGFTTDKFKDFFGFLSQKSGSKGFFVGLKEDFVSNFKEIKKSIENPVDSFNKLKSGAIDSFSAITEASKNLGTGGSGFFSGLLTSATGFFETIKKGTKDVALGLADIAVGLKDGAVGALKSVKEMEFSFGGLKKAMSGGLSGVVGLLTTGLSAAIAGASTAFGVLATAAKFAWAAVSGPMAPLLLVLGAVTAGVALLYDKFFGFGKAADNLNKEFENISKETSKSLEEVDKTFEATAKAADETLLSSFKKLGEEAPKSVLGIEDSIKPLKNEIEIQKGAFGSLLDMIKNGFKDPLKAIKDFILNITGLGKAIDVVSSASNNLGGFFNKITDFIKKIPLIGDAVELLENVGKTIGGLVDGVGKFFGGIKEAYELDQIVEPVSKLRKAGEDLATDQLRASKAIGAYNKGLFQTKELNELVLKGNKLSTEQVAIKTALLEKESAAMQRLVDRANAETGANNKRIEEAQKLADQYKKVTKDASGNEVEDLKNQDIRRVKLLEEIEIIEAKNKKLQDSVSQAKEELQLVIKLQQERERLQERVRNNKGDDLDPTKGDVAGENYIKNSLNRGLQASTEELDNYSKKVQAVLDGTGKYLETTTDKTGNKITTLTKIKLTDLEGATDKLDEKVMGAVGAVDALFEQGYIDSDKAAEKITETLEKTVTGSTGKIQKLKELLDPQTQIDLINQVVDYQQKASQSQIGLKTKEIEKLKSLDEARLANSSEVAKNIRKIEAEQMEIQRTTLEKQIAALVNSKQGSPQKIKELTADLEKLKSDQKGQQIRNSVSDANQENNDRKQQLDKDLELQKTYEAAKIGSVEATSKKIRQIEEEQLGIQRKNLQNEIDVLTAAGSDPKKIAELQKSMEKLNVESRAKQMKDKIDDATKETEATREKLGNQLELERTFQQARIGDNVETTKKINQLELQQLQASKLALEAKVKIMKQTGVDPEEIKKVEQQITLITAQESAKRITNIQSEMAARVAKVKQATEKQISLDELARLKGEKSFKDASDNAIKLRQETNAKEQQLLLEQINRTKSAGGNTDELQKQLIDKQIEYQKILTEKIQKEVERRKQILSNSVNEQVLEQTKLLNSLDAQSKSLESENKLQDSRKSLLEAQNQYQVAMLQNQLKTTNDVVVRADIEKQIAERNFKNLQDQQSSELASLQVQEQQNKLAAEREQIQLRLSKLQNQLSQDQLKLDIETATRTRSKSEEEIVAMNNQLATLAEQGNVLEQQQGLLEKNSQQQQEITKNNRLQLEYKQRSARESASIDLELAKNKQQLAVFEKMAQTAKIRADITQTVADIELKSATAIGKLNENRTKLLNQQKEIIDDSLSASQNSYQIAADLTTDEKEKAQIQKEALMVRAATLDKQQSIEKELLEIQLQQNKLAQERQKIEADIAVIRKSAELQAVIAEDKRIQADKTKSKEEKEASSATVAAKQVDVAAANYERDILTKQQELTKKDEEIQRRKLSNKQFQETQGLQVELAKSTEDKNDDIVVRNNALANARSNASLVSDTPVKVANTELPKFADYIKQLNISLPKLSDLTQQSVKEVSNNTSSVRNNNSTSNVNNNSAVKQGDIKVDAPITINIEKAKDNDIAVETGSEVYNVLYDVFRKVEQRV